MLYEVCSSTLFCQKEYSHRNRCVCIFIYFAYFFNMSELARIVPDSEKISHILIEQGRKITFIVILVIHLF